jgi:hypothetical protein
MVIAQKKVLSVKSFERLCAKHRLQRTPKELGQAATPPLANIGAFPEVAR